MNRGVESYVQAGNLLNSFLSGIKNTSTITANTDIISTRDPTAPIHLSTNPSNNTTLPVGTIADLERFAVNGNKNILSVRGNLTIDSCGANHTLTLTGIRTLVVE